MINHPAAPQDSFSFSNNINYDPGTMMVAGSAVSAGASLYSGMAQANAYNAQAAVDQQNADLADQNAEAIIELASQQIIAFEEQYDGFESDTIVNYAKSGVSLDSPTVIEVMHNNRSQAEVEKANIRYNARIGANSEIVNANQLRTSAAINKMNAKTAKIVGIANAAAASISAYGGYKQVKTQSLFNESMLASQSAFTAQLLEMNNQHRKLLIEMGIYN